MTRTETIDALAAHLVLVLLRALPDVKLLVGYLLPHEDESEPDAPPDDLRIDVGRVARAVMSCGPAIELVQAYGATHEGNHFRLVQRACAWG
jgi:hypothetical protein